VETNVNPDTAGELRERRLAAGLTQQQLANLADCSLTHLQLLERGYRPTRSEVRTRVLAALREHEAVCQPEDEREGDRRTDA
jgi:transcriptional regulator with XRE-family HTH domain